MGPTECSLLEGTDATSTTSPGGANPKTPPHGLGVLAATLPPSKYVVLLGLMKALQCEGKKPSSKEISELALQDTNVLVNNEVGLILAEAGMTLGNPRRSPRASTINLCMLWSAHQN